MRPRAAITAVLAALAFSSHAQDAPPNVTPEMLAKDNRLFLTLARKHHTRGAQPPTSYPGIGGDFRRTHHLWERLEADIFLAAHAEWFGYEEKRRRTAAEGVRAWVNPEEYRQFVARYKRQFEDQVDRELRVATSAK